MLLRQQFACLNHVVDAFPLIRDLHRPEQDELTLLRKVAFPACLSDIVRFEEIGIDGVGDVHHGMSAEQFAFPRQAFEPTAARHERDMPALIELLLLEEDAVRKVPLSTPSVEERTVMALLLVTGTLTRMMANAGAGPHIVHGPHDGFARCQDFLDIFQGEHTLVYPVEVDDVGLLKLRQGGDVAAGIGYVDGKKVTLLEVVGLPDDDTFPYEFPHQAPVLLESHHGDLFGLLVAHQHLGFDAAILERFH